MTLVPDTIEALADIVRDAGAGRRTMEIVGGGTRAGFGRPVVADDQLCTAGLQGITIYEPAELVMSARAGTPLSQIEGELQAHGQMLAFEPVDHRPILGSQGTPTIAGAFAVNASGHRRVVSGAARDHLLGAQLVNGRGELIRAGGRVMKNVTGLDMTKLMAGAFGTLGILAEVTFKVLPRPETSSTLVISMADGQQAVDLMTRAMGSPYDVSGAAWRHHEVLLRLEGFERSVEYRVSALADLLGRNDSVVRAAASEQAWRSIADLSALDATVPQEIWRVSVAPSRAPALLASVPAACRTMLDWSGGLIWIACDAALEQVLRQAVERLGGHATLLRASAERRTAVDVFHPLKPGVLALTRGIKHSFDPDGIFNPGRMYGGI
jgi:glycolate oxidase FAD binding subunit